MNELFTDTVKNKYITVNEKNQNSTCRKYIINTHTSIQRVPSLPLCLFLCFKNLRPEPQNLNYLSQIFLPSRG